MNEVTDVERKVIYERRNQRDKWGDAHDDRHLPSDWSSIALYYFPTYLTRKFMDSPSERGSASNHLIMMDQLIKLAAVIIAWAEYHKRKADYISRVVGGYGD